MYTIHDLARITNGVLIQGEVTLQQVHIAHLLIDSRKVIYPESSVFIAITGSRNNGHLYLQDAYDTGVRHFIVEQYTNGQLPDDAMVVQVDNTLRALQEIAAFHRRTFKCPVVGITGSNGKTIIKEWLHFLLKDDVKIVRNPKSFNSQVGVPLSVWGMNEEHELGLFEAGISMPDEMSYLQHIIKPDIGIFTYLGSAHDEGFKNRNEKLEEKLKLFYSADILIYCADQPEVTQGVMKLLLNHNPSLNVISWSRNNQDATYSFDIEYRYQYTVITTRKGAQTISINLPFVDEAAVVNACTCFAFLMSINRVSTDVLKRFEELQPVEMRMQLKEGVNNSVIINDAYNADVNALQIALDFMEQQSSGYQKTVILSDLLESGVNEVQLYSNIASLIKQRNIQFFIGIGEAVSKYKALFPKNSLFFNDTSSFIQNFKSLDFTRQIILVKGARKFMFERITALLEKKVHETVFEVNLNAMVHNLNVYRSKLKRGVKIMGMVKAFSYGAGSYEIAKVLEYNRADYLAVAYADEGVALRKAGIKLPIMVMNPEPVAFDAILQYNLEPEVYNFYMLEQLLKVCNGDEVGIHIEVDTGMKRLGFDEEQLEELILLLQQNPNVRVKSVFSHLAASEDKKHDAFTLEQIRKFSKMADVVKQAFPYQVLSHVLNSSGIIRFQDAQFDMVRLGIGLYGIDPGEKIQKQLQVIGTLKTVISQIREVKSHETIGYSRRGTVQRDSKIAIVAIGYADGLSRKLGNGKGYMMINGHKAPIIGSICMDMAMVDVTHISCKEGDEVIVFGNEIDIKEVATKTGTIAYEVLTAVSQRVKRVYYYE
ncbi:MAG: bifunctional UDP-N-acetylmuramoyl-tripeptide:D-alanyl-D-alanine ligase/alanine racemase [Bacteroidia bacterium]|jgi:alanine racemase|nr:bifunctional UDP-N-acetylmuramoyl-tripeptide:D-alanyl-D-alanine ligase/alanine racemase [Bacteroidia bacterium]